MASSDTVPARPSASPNRSSLGFPRRASGSNFDPAPEVVSGLENSCLRLFSASRQPNKFSTPDQNCPQFVVDFVLAERLIQMNSHRAHIRPNLPEDNPEGDTRIRFMGCTDREEMKQ